MTKLEYRDQFKNIVRSNKNKFDMFAAFDDLAQQMYKEEWFVTEMENKVLKEIDKFVDVRDISIGDKNYFISNDTE